MVDLPDGYGEQVLDDFKDGVGDFFSWIPQIPGAVGDGLGAVFNVAAQPGLNEPSAYLTAMVVGIAMWGLAPRMIGGLLNMTPLGGTGLGGIAQAIGSLAVIGASAYAAFVAVDNLDSPDLPRDPVEIIEPDAPSTPDNGVVGGGTVGAPTPSLGLK